MKGAIRKHPKSDEHKDGRLKWFNENAPKMPEHVVVMQDRYKDRVITCMKLAYFVTRQDLALMKYESLCELVNEIGAKDMPLQKECSSYTNATAGKKFLFCIANHLARLQQSDILSSPYYALMLDESTDRGHEKHLIVYIAFLAKAGKGQCKCEFLRLSTVADGCAKTKYDAIINMMSKFGLEAQCLVGIATDGDSSMVGCHDGLVAKLVRDIPHLISVHCVAHREALAVVDACKSVSCLGMWIRLQIRCTHGFLHLI
ncbi:hypothetical protein L7F22_057380 [Adiantum nelumboides]|nr:hypothetical protein [Adiantum nelumboides]